MNLQSKVIIANTIRIITFAVLAVIFRHWWIVLVSALFLTSIERKED